jgi:hypothetical protein
LDDQNFEKFSVEKYIHFFTTAGVSPCISSLKNDVKSNIVQNLLSSWRSLTKRAGSGAGSDPDNQLSFYAQLKY